MQGERSVEKYREAGIHWGDYCGSILVNSYPTYFEKLPPLIDKINRELRPSKNYVLFLGATDAESNQAPCLSLVQFQIVDGELVITAYQRSSDANLGLPADMYHLYLMSRHIALPLRSITIFLGNVHIYESNIDATRSLLAGHDDVKFSLNVCAACICPRLYLSSARSACSLVTSSMWSGNILHTRSLWIFSVAPDSSLTSPSALSHRPLSFIMILTVIAGASMPSRAPTGCSARYTDVMLYSPPPSV